MSNAEITVENIGLYLAQARQMIKPIWQVETENWIRGMCIADINRNGKLEVAIAAQGQTLQVVDAGTGEQVWNAAVEQTLFNVFAADIDRDGETEIIVGAGTSTQSITLEGTDAHRHDELRGGAIYILSETGQLKWQVAHDDKVRGLAVADINGDNACEIIAGLEDNRIVVTDRSGASIWSYKTGEWVYVIHLADLDKDGKLEIIAGSGDGYVYVFKADGQLLWRFQTGDRVYSVDTGDIDNNGQIEIAVGSGDRNIYILSREGVCKAVFAMDDRVRNVALADCDGDGYLEIIVGLGDKHVCFVNAKGELLWRFKGSNGVIRSLQIASLPDKKTLLVVGGEESVASAYEVLLEPDICKAIFALANALPESSALDAQDEQLLEELTGKPFSELGTSSSELNLYERCLNTLEQEDWAGALHWAYMLLREKLYRVYTYITGQWSNVDAADVNGDHKFEIAVGSGDRSIYFYELYGKLLWSFETGERVRAVHITDFDQNGQSEILVGSGDRHIYIFMPDGELKARFQTKDRVRSLYAADIDRDGEIEIIAGIGERTLAVFNQTGGLKWDFEAQDRIYSVYASDVNQNGAMEVICGSGDRTVYVFSCTGEKIWLRETGDWVNSVYARDIDADGKVEVLVGSGDRCVHCFDGHDGTLKWKYETNERVYSVCVDDVDRDGYCEVIAGSEDKFIYVLDHNGDLKWKYQTEDWIRSIVGADLDNDGHQELVVGSYGPNVSIYRVVSETDINPIIQHSWENLLRIKGTVWETIKDLLTRESPYLKAFAVQNLATSELADELKFDVAMQMWESEKHPEIRIALLLVFGKLYPTCAPAVMTMVKQAILEILSSDVTRRTRQVSEIEQALLESSLLVFRHSPEDGFSLLQLLVERGSKLTRRNIARASIDLLAIDIEHASMLLDSLVIDTSEWVKYETARTISSILDREPDRMLSILQRLLHLRAFDVFQTIFELSRRDVVKQVFEVYGKLLRTDEADFGQVLTSVAPILRDNLVAYRLGEEVGLVYRLITHAFQVQTVSEIVTLLPQLTRSIGMIGRQQDFRDVRSVLTHLAVTTRHLNRYEKEDILNDKFTCLIDATNEVEKTEELLDSVTEPEKRALRLLISHWGDIILDALQSLQSRASLEAKLRTRRVFSAERVTVEVEIANKGKGVAENIKIALEPGSSDSFQIEGQHNRNIGALYSGDTSNIVYTLTHLAKQALEVKIDVQFDDFNERGKHVRASEQLTVLDLPGTFEPIKPNPYVFGRPLVTDEVFFGRKDVIEFVEANLGREHHNNIIVLQGERRTGKTSILYRLKHHLTPDFIPVVVDIPSVTADRGAAIFLYSFAYKLYDELKAYGMQIELPRREEYNDAPAFQFREVFLPAILSKIKDRKLILMLDEIAGIDQAVKEGRLDNGIFSLLRGIMQHSPQLEFILTGAREIKSLTASYAASLFNIGAVMRIGLLEKRDASELITAPVRTTGMDYDDLALEKIYDLTAGHPYFTQMLCHELVERRNRLLLPYVGINDVNEVIQSIVRTGQPYLSYIWSDSASVERIALFSVVRVLTEKHVAKLSEVMTLARQYVQNLDENDFREALSDWIERDVLVELSTMTEPIYKFKMDLVRVWLYKTITPEMVAREI